MRTPYPLWGYKWREKGKEAPSAIPRKFPMSPLSLPINPPRVLLSGKRLCAIPAVRASLFINLSLGVLFMKQGRMIFPEDRGT